MADTFFIASGLLVMAWAAAMVLFGHLCHPNPFRDEMLAKAMAWKPAPTPEPRVFSLTRWEAMFSRHKMVEAL